MPAPPRLPTGVVPENFTEPAKRIHDGADLQFFLQSLAYRDVVTFILQLNRSMVPRKRIADNTIHEYRLDGMQQQDLLPQVKAILDLLNRLQTFIEDAPPDTGPRRFGNVSFRKWYKLVEDGLDAMLAEILPSKTQPAIVELKAYLLGSFGSAQRLDYGTGHELSFLAFLAALWKLGYFTSPAQSSTTSHPNNNTDSTSTIERQIVLSLFQTYLSLIRSLIQVYNLEPAGSHGVWGLDDNSFLPYIFGSAQLAPAIPEDNPSSPSPPIPTPTSGSLPSAVDPTIITKPTQVDAEAKSNLYFSSIQFIYTVKRGPFWEHSPMLFDISGIKDGWGKINKGLIKMYEAEVLGKFPVVQHFVFGSIFRWEKDPDAKVVQQTTHSTSHPLRNPMVGAGGVASTRPGQGVGTAAPWASVGGGGTATAPTGFVNGVTQAPWARQAGSQRPLHPPPPSLSGSRGGLSASLLRGPERRPVSAASANELKLAAKTAETIPEGKEVGDGN
ncbi:Serine/threonine-protein phosphatase 2A activator 1 [Neophaeococcomyces mojaviensis]|uniref:Serine/threonine-protein phosphatase 2A activator 1 n=1 Tax=Neophaeococcomyces mojaviensis TaxID=3383035 RepID=A0ACC2ZUK6_9EURO|nr:Serine/threonine-protein phosphatase 2A activator 1 [Knufia sp. JES_112]